MATATPQLMKIEKKVLIHAPRARVWRALTTPAEFAKWFSAQVHGSFVPGERVEMVSTHPACTGDPRFYLIVDRIEPEHIFSWRWHPGSAKADEDQTTFVEFQLEEVPEGTLVSVTESGFDHIAIARRAKAFEENTHGWEIQLESLQQHATQAV